LQLYAGGGFELEQMDNTSPEQRESLWRRNSTGQKRARLDGQPELELEARLTGALARMPDSPVPSNFTARVLDAIDREDVGAARSKGWRWNWHALLPRTAVAMAVLLFAGIGLQHHETAQRERAAVAKSLQVAASASVVPDVDALNNFDAIQRMGQTVHADTDLLVALQ
jgi:hypothetical protein